MRLQRGYYEFNGVWFLPGHKVCLVTICLFPPESARGPRHLVTRSGPLPTPNLPTNIIPTNIAWVKPSEIHNVSREIGRNDSTGPAA